MKQLLLITTILVLCPAIDRGVDSNARIDLASQAGNNLSRSITFNFKRTQRTFGHLEKPWQTSENQISGTFCLSRDLRDLYVLDSMTYRKRNYHSSSFYTRDSLFVMDYGKTEPNAVTKEEADAYINTAALYSPVFLIDDLFRGGIDKESTGLSSGEQDTVTYRRRNGHIIRLLFDPVGKHLSEVHITYPHEMYGDVKKKITYSEYKRHSIAGIYFPTRVVEEELGVVKNELLISEAEKDIDVEVIRKKIPLDYKLSADLPPQPEITYQKFNDHIHLLDFKHTDDRVLVVEFESFLAVAEAPLNSANGELIISKAREIAPAKPIRYFVFGHHHPHYIGGIRAFVANGTAVICHEENLDYVNQILSFSHSLQPDALEKKPREAIIQTMDSTKYISDGDLKMQIIHIGEMSDHTTDYLIYYFPRYNLLFEDDLIWIKKDGPIAPARDRQKGLYNAIRKYGLKVETIIQSWPVNEHGVKTIIDFKDLKRSVELTTRD